MFASVIMYGTKLLAQKLGAVAVRMELGLNFIETEQSRYARHLIYSCHLPRLALGRIDRIGLPCSEY